MAFVQKMGDLVIACGMAVKDGEFREVGNGIPLGKFTIVCGNKPGTEEGRFVDCQAWRRNAGAAAGIRKGDTVFAIGRVETREHEGKSYSNLVCDWYNVLPNMSPAEFSSSAATFTDMMECSDGELPF